MTATRHTATDQGWDDPSPDEVSMALPAVEVRARMTRQWADRHSPDWTVRQHLHRDVPALLAEVERLHAEVQQLRQAAREAAR